MAFTVEDYRDLVQLLSERPEFRLGGYRAIASISRPSRSLVGNRNFVGGR